MKPALSVLIFTVSSGAGYGLLIWLLLFYLFSPDALALALSPDSLRTYFGLYGGIGLVLVTLGLLSSTLHLANPKNAWRAFNRFRTSWLSREGVFALLFYPAFILFAALLWFGVDATGLTATTALVALAIAFATLVCTGMIYASLKPIRQWHNNLTTPIYIGFSLMSGSLLYGMLYQYQFGKLPAPVFNAFITSLIVTLLLKLLYFWHIGKPDGAGKNRTTIGDATGFSQAQVRLMDAGHSSGTFLTKEFVYDAGALRLLILRRCMLVLTFVIPLALIIWGRQVGIPSAVYLAMVFMLGGTLLERWLFFAEARHVVRLYHGDQSN
ncbi:MAG: dimethyl sulfoxide reductase anchor subunit [Gammaproteobacteria bacterium]|nr:dimethyl sulfoxide reductase anchor subunit [Gammaproteobacteria bacterium]